MSTSDFSAAQADIQIDSGDDETVQLTRENSNGNAIDISNYEFWLTVKWDKSDADSDAVLQKNVTTHTDPTNGKTEFVISPSDTEDEAGVYYWDIQEKTGAGHVNTLVEGNLIINQDVTEST